MKDSQAGYTLIEVLASVAILGMIGVTFLSAMMVGTKAAVVADERTTAESLSQAQLEYVMRCEYDDYGSPPQYDLSSDIPIPSKYSVEVEAERLDPFGDGTQNDDGVQKIIIRVYHEGKLVTSTEGYKARHE